MSDPRLRRLKNCTFIFKKFLGKGGFGSVWKVEFVLPKGTRIAGMHRGFPLLHEPTGQFLLCCPCHACSFSSAPAARTAGYQAESPVEELVEDDERKPLLDARRHAEEGAEEDDREAPVTTVSSAERPSTSFCPVANCSVLVGTGLEYAVKFIELPKLPELLSFPHGSTTAEKSLVAQKRERERRHREQQRQRRREDCLKEIKMLEDLRDASVCVDLFLADLQSDTGVSLVLELAHYDLATWMSTHFEGSVSQLMCVWGQLVEIAHVMRTKNIIHFDVKPLNFLVFGADLRFPVIKLADFGLAQKLEDDKSAISAAEAGPGTLKYIAPEVLHQPKKNSWKFPPSVDIWGYGLILHQLLIDGVRAHGHAHAHAVVLRLPVRFVAVR